jgi:hypothetical protein
MADEMHAIAKRALRVKLRRQPGETRYSRICPPPDGSREDGEKHRFE